MSDEARGTPTLHQLAEHHRAVCQLFEQARDPELADEALAPVAQQACGAWARLSRIEEELFYPRLQSMGLAPRQVHEALIETQLATGLAERLAGMQADDEAYRAGLAVLGECIRHHLDKEEERLFPLAAALDLGDIAERLRKSPEEPPRPVRAKDGRLDVGTAEDRSPPLS